ncbi:MAG: DMT family transporter [Cyanobacteria bacterium P01_H01_bin.58]
MPVLGYVLILLSSAFFCIQNVVVRILFAEHPLIGIGVTGGFLTPTLQNSFLLLLLRMVLAVPLMGLFSLRLYPKIWQDLGHLRQPLQRRALFHALAGGGLMFAYLALLYVSIGLIPTGIALTLFFTFPVFTALFSWRFFDHRPTMTRWGIMAAILLGSALTIPQEQWTGGGSYWGALFGVAAGVTYALYTVNAQKSFDYLHPVPYTWVSFAITLGLSAACLLIWPRSAMPSLAWGAIWFWSLVSGFVTFAGHVLYNSGIRQIGATSAAMIGAANPALTVVLAWLAIQEVLQGVQVLGVGIVTLSVASLSRTGK